MALQYDHWNYYVSSVLFKSIGDSIKKPCMIDYTRKTHGERSKVTTQKTSTENEIRLKKRFCQPQV